MDDLFQATIEEKFKVLTSSVDELRSFLPKQRQEYAEDTKTQAAVERVCQKIIECTIDTNSEVLRRIDKSRAPRGRAGFQRMLELGIVGGKTYRRFAEEPNAYLRFRNLIVHVYDKIDAVAAYYTAQRLIPDAMQYGKEIRQYLDSLEIEDVDESGERSPS